MPQLPKAFLDEFDLAVVLSPKTNLPWLIGTNDDAAWISARPVPMVRESPLECARFMGNRVILVIRKAREKIFAATVTAAVENVTFEAPNDLDGPAGAALFSFLMEFRTWSEVAEAMNADRVAMGLPRIDPKNVDGTPT